MKPRVPRLKIKLEIERVDQNGVKAGNNCRILFHMEEFNLKPLLNLRATPLLTMSDVRINVAGATNMTKVDVTKLFNRVSTDISTTYRLFSDRNSSIFLLCDFYRFQSGQLVVTVLNEWHILGFGLQWWNCLL